MSVSIKDFMKAELKDLGTMEFEGVETFKDKDGNKIPFIIKRLSQKQMREIRDRYKTVRAFRDKKNRGSVLVVGGRVAMEEEYDAEKAGREMMVEAFVQPKLDDPDLMAYYGVYDRLDMPGTLFSEPGDLDYANDCLMVALGLKDGEDKDEEDEIEELKN